MDELSEDVLAEKKNELHDSAKAKPDDEVVVGKEEDQALSSEASWQSARFADGEDTSKIRRSQQYNRQEVSVRSLIMNVIPWGMVCVDDRRIGYPPPVYVEHLTVGEHVVKVERTGFRSVRRKVEISVGKVTPVHIHFQTESK